MPSYYAIIGVALNAIPVVTSYLILGVVRGGASLISQGMSSHADYLSTGAYSAQSNRKIMELRYKLMDLQLNRAKSYLANQKLGRERESGFTPFSMLGRGQAGEGMRRGADGRSQLEFTPFGNLSGGKARAVSGDRLAKEGRRGQQIGGVLDGLSALNGPILGGSDGPGGKTASGIQFVGRVADATKGLAETYSKAAFSIRGKEFQTSSTWAAYDASYSIEGVRYMREARLYNILPLPWSANGGWDDETSERLNEWVQYKDGVKAAIKSLTTFATNRPKNTGTAFASTGSIKKVIPEVGLATLGTAMLNSGTFDQLAGPQKPVPSDSAVKNANKKLKPKIKEAFKCRKSASLVCSIIF